MHFDDRLGTVLRHRPQSGAIARIQYRQLLDLLGTLPSDARSPQIEAGFARLSELSAELTAPERAAMIDQPGLRLRSTRLVALLARDAAPVAKAAIGAARLDDEEWLDLVPALPMQARGLMRSRRDLGPAVTQLMQRLGIGDRTLPPAESAVQAPEPEMETVGLEADEAEPALPPAALATVHELPVRRPTSSIGAIVQRIEDFRKTQKAAESGVHSANQHGDAPRLPLGDINGEAPAVYPRVFDFVTDGEGRINWATAPFAPMAVGLRLLSAGTDSASGFAVSGAAAIAQIFRRRQPLRGADITLTGAPAISGVWQLDATPRFDRLGGRFLGYIGRMRRPAAALETPFPAPVETGESDRMRQLLHELRTPVNAIQGFAEVIQQQLFGPTPHEYRALAANIAGDAARILAGFEDLERLAHLEGGASSLDNGECDLAELLTATVRQLEPFTGPRGGGFTVTLGEEALPIALAATEAERLIWRLLATLVGAAGPGEVLKLRARAFDGKVQLVLQLPASLAARSDEELFRAAAAILPQVVTAGMFGIGFTLRLARAEALGAGGSLERREEKLRLVLPGLTATAPPHSQDAAVPA